jgi:RNA recognition motif-containing protein
MTSIFVAKLDFNITSEQLKQAFQAYGTVIKATVATDRETGKSRGFGFVEMADRDEANAAIKGLDGSMMNGRPIAVKEAEQRPDNRPNRDQRSDSNRSPREPRPDFNRNRDQGNGFPRPAPTDRSERSESRDSGSFTPPPIVEDPFKTDRKKERAPDKDKKAKDKEAEGKAKKPKMSAYKKSGKNNRFFDDDDDLDDLDNASFFNFDDEEEDDED